MKTSIRGRRGHQHPEPVDELQRYYQIGKTADKSPTDLAKANLISADNARKARKFAELFTPDDLAACYPQRGGVGKPLTWTHIRHLVSVDAEKARRKLIRAAVDEGWAVSRLSREIRIAVGTKATRRHGRRATPAPTIEHAMFELQQLSEKWMEYWNASKEALGCREDESFMKVQAAPSPAKGSTLCRLNPQQVGSIRGVFGKHRKALEYAIMILMQLDPNQLAQVRAKSRKSGKA